MSSKKVRNLFKFGRAKSQSTTDLSEWSKSDEKLMKAVEGQDAKKVSSILSKKSMVPSKLGPRGHSIFHVACAMGNPQIVELLLKETDDVNDLTIQGNTCLQLAAAKGHEVVVQRLIQSGAEVDMRDSNDMTALHHACAGLHYGCVHALLQGGADPRCTEKGGKTPLFYAAHRGEIGICKLLVDKGADVNAADKLQLTPLMVAAKEGNRDACEFLLKRGANPSSSDREGHMALYYAMASGHTELREVFASAPTRASWDLSSTDGASPKTEKREERVQNTVVESHPASPLSSAVSEGNEVTSFTPDLSPQARRPADAVRSLAGSDVETMSQSEDESPTPRRTSDPTQRSTGPSVPLQSKDTQAYKELEAEHEQLSEEYHALSIENLRLRDKVEFLQQRMNGKHEQGNGAKEVAPAVQEEIRNLKAMLEEEKEHSKELESRLAARPSEGAEVHGDTDTWHDSDDEELFEGKKTKGGKDMNDKQVAALLRSQLLTLRQENEQLRNNAQTLHNGYQESSTSGPRSEEDGQPSKDTLDGQKAISSLLAEKEQLKTEILKLKEAAASQELSGALGQEELVLNNTKLQAQVEELRSAVEALEGEKSTLEQKVSSLEEYGAGLPSDKVAVMNSAKLMEEVKFDEEGFVEGQDLTKEEFLQAQNEQLKVQCGLLTEELSKLRATFDAILKAGDNLQSDYDQLQAEKDKLHDQLEVVLREKEEVVKENEFLLSDGNALHEDLKKLVQELEKMQEKYRKVCAEKEQLQHQHNAVTIAGKVGEVSRLLEEREKMQGRLAEAEETAARLTHDQAILLEEVQSQQERVTSLTTERDALQAEMEDTENLVTQHEALTQEYAQLEMDFNELLKEKERLEADLQTRDGGAAPPHPPSDPSAMTEERDLLMAERDQLELTIKELSRENAVLEEELESLRTRLAEGSGDMATLGTAQLELTVKELSKENAELEEELANTQELISNMESQLLAKEGAATEDGDVEVLKASVSQLEATVSELSRENADLEEELGSVKEQLDRAQEALENRRLLEGLSSPATDSSVQDLQQEKQTLTQQVQELQARLAQAETGVNGEADPNLNPALLNKNLVDGEDLKATVASLEKDKAGLQSELDSVQRQLVAMERQLGDGGGKQGRVNGMMGDGMSRLAGGEMDGDLERVETLKQEVSALQQELSDLQQVHCDTINTYRTHLLSAVQGHMDPEVKEALHSIIEMRSMEQFC